jgi:hypothetical protein
LVYDDKLNLLWSHDIEIDLTSSYIEEICILITSHRMMDGDRGAIIVGGRLNKKTDFTSYHLHMEKPEVNIEFQPVKDEVNEDSDEPVTETLLNDHSYFGRNNHFSYYCFEGFTGVLRWKHESSDFIEESPAADILRPQHDAHSGAVDWRNFRKSIAER